MVDETVGKLDDIISIGIIIYGYSELSSHVPLPASLDGFNAFLGMCPIVLTLPAFEIFSVSHITLMVFLPSACFPFLYSHSPKILNISKKASLTSEKEL